MSPKSARVKLNPATPARPFVYAAVSGSLAASNSPQGRVGSGSGLWPVPIKHPDGRADAEWKARESAAREKARQEGESSARAGYERELVREREALAAALQDWGRERAGYVQHLETEAVRLALAVARKILHREAQVDPLMLTGAVRAALEKVSAATSLTLQVHPARVALWQDFLARQAGLAPAPQVVGDEALQESQCRLDSSLGSADLGWESQFRQIEQGLLDLLARNPETDE